MFIAIDTGGTFTDLVAFNPADRSVCFTKALTTHEDPFNAMLTCVDKVGLDLAACTLFRHGTTKLINLLLERKGPRVALVTTEGFTDVLEIGRGNRTEPFNLFFRRSPSLVPADLRFGVKERTDGAGQCVVMPEREEVAALARQIRARGAEAIAVSFMNAYAGPANEQQVAQWLRELLPEMFVSAGSELTREWYEYERACTAAANAYGGPEIGRYVAALEASLEERRFMGKLVLMGSNGGVLSGRHAAQAPILLVESGPVGGCIGAQVYGKALDLPRLVAFDMGGTTAKCAIIDGAIEVESTYYVGGYGHGIPIRAPVVDIVEVGAGGGSIVWLDGHGHLHVGPRSAGSFPGPVAYGRGGTEPTVTDANLLLGRLSVDNFQGGEMKLDVDSVRSSIEALAQTLAMAGDAPAITLANGILSIAAARMSEAIKRVSVEKGHDPADLVLFAYGGGGPLHAVELARELSIPEVVIPPEAGNFSAIGMLLADIRRDESRILVGPLGTAVLRQADALFSELEQQMTASMREDFGARTEVRFEHALAMRYVGQYHTVRVPYQGQDESQLRADFERIYRGRYGHARATAALEVVSTYCAAMAVAPRPDVASLYGRLPQGHTASPRSRAVVHSGSGAAVDTPVHRRAELPIGFAGAGPAVIEEYGSTTLIGPLDRFRIGQLGEIRIAVASRRGVAA